MLKLCDHFEIPLSILPSLQYMYLVRYCEANCCARLVHSRHLLKILAHYCDILFARKNIFQMATLKTGGRVQHPRKSRFCVFATFRVKLTLSVDVYKTLCYCRKSAVYLNTWHLFWIWDRVPVCVWVRHRIRPEIGSGLGSGPDLRPGLRFGFQPGLLLADRHFPLISCCMALKSKLRCM